MLLQYNLSNTTEVFPTRLSTFLQSCLEALIDFNNDYEWVDQFSEESDARCRKTEENELTQCDHH